MGRKKTKAPAPRQERPPPGAGGSSGSSEPGPAAACSVIYTPHHAGRAPPPEAAAPTAAAATGEDGSTNASPPRTVRFLNDDAIATIHQLDASSSINGDLSSCCSHAAGYEASSPLAPRESGGPPQQQEDGSAARGGVRGCWRAFEARVKQLKRDVLALSYAVHDPRTPLLAKLLPWLVLAYALSPLDLVPDFLPVLGYLDDMLLLPLGLWLSVRLIPEQVMADSRARAAAEPLRLSQNWVVATLIFTAWLAGLLATAHWLIGSYGAPQLQQWELPLLGVGGALAVLVFVGFTTVQCRKEARRRAEMALLASAQQREPLLATAGSDDADKQQQSGDEAV